MGSDESKVTLLSEVKKGDVNINIPTSYPPTTGLLDSMDPQTVRNSLYMLLNLCSSVGIVMANKWVFDIQHFKFGTLLTVIHFVATFAGLEVCAKMGMFERKHIRPSDVIGLCAAFSAFVVLTNLSLQYNSVGFYQVNPKLLPLHLKRPNNCGFISFVGLDG